MRLCRDGADAASGDDFVDRAAAFVNDRLWGNLAPGVMVAPEFRAEVGKRGSIPGSSRAAAVRYDRHQSLARDPSYALMCTPWGGFPEGTLEDPKSGLGWVHNTYLLDAAQKPSSKGR